VAYPAEALAKGVEGTVVVRVKLDANAEVSDATVLSGPDELRKAVLQSVLNWHFDKSAASGTRTVNVDFVKPAVAAQPQAVGAGGGRGGSGGRMMAAYSTASPALAAVPMKLDRIEVAGLSDAARAQLLASLPVHEGDDWNAQTLALVRTAASQFDSHLTVSAMRSVNGAMTLRLGVNAGTASVSVGYGMAGAMPLASSNVPGGVYSVGNGTSAPSVLSKVDPQYTEEARTAKYRGSVLLSIVVNSQGQADNIAVVRSLGMGLDEKAIEAVQQWRFRPGTNNGVPVNVRAQIEVNFNLL
jgi:TonB family protein